MALNFCARQEKYHSFGFKLELPSAKEARDKFPYMPTKGALGLFNRPV